MLSFENGLSEAVGRELMAALGGNQKDNQVPFPLAQDDDGSYSRSVSLLRANGGFGFTLRHFVIYPPDLINKSNEASKKSINGLDKAGFHPEEEDAQKTEPVDVVFIRQVSPSSPADRAGLSTGDQIIAVNGGSVLGKSYSEVVQLIQESQDLLDLTVVPKEDSILQLVSPSISSARTSTSNISELTYDCSESDTLPRRVVSSATVTPACVDASGSPQNAAAIRLQLPGAADSSVSSVNFRRNSVDRVAQENRGFVVTGISHSLDSNSNHLQRKAGPAAAAGVALHSAPSKMDGSYFVAATDSTGRARALHFENKTSPRSALSVPEGSKVRSRSLTTEPYGPEGRYAAALDKKLSLSSRTDQISSHGANPLGAAGVGIPQFALSAPRTFSSDGLSTSYVSTNSDSGGRQPVASEAGSGRGRAAGDAAPGPARPNQDRLLGLQSSTVGATLLESRPGYSRVNGDRPPSPRTAPRSGDAPQTSWPSDEPSAPGAFSSQMSMFPKKPSYEEVIFSQSETGEITAGHKPRRISYLMATGGRSPPHSRRAAPPAGGRELSRPADASAAAQLQPMMVHVSSGIELCEDIGMAGDDCSQQQEGDGEGDQNAGIQRADKDVSSRGFNRRTSYVIATSSPTSPRHMESLAAMQEENEDVFEDNKEGVPGLSEVSKAGQLYRKVAVGDGGKRSNARSWKPVTAVLKGHVLYLQKDKINSHQGESATDEQPVSIKSCIVDIAHDYTKRKNVFRVTTFNGSEFLFQAEDHVQMMEWIHAIQSNNNPDADENGVTSESVIIRRIRNVEHETTGMTVQAPVNKLSPPTSTKIITEGITSLKKSLSFKNVTAGPKDKGESKNHWHKKRKKKNSPLASQMNYPEGHTFGVPLDTCPDGSYKCVPLIVEHCCEVVQQRGLDTVGVYRVPGNAAAVAALQEEANTKGVENINFDEEKWNDVNNMTSLMKQFLRKLPEGLVNADLYSCFMEANKKEDPVDRMLALKERVYQLPEANVETLKLLMAHLKVVADNCDKNKMEARNLAIVFGPTLVRTGEDTMMSLVRDMSDQCRIVESLITHCDWFFSDTSEGDDSAPKPPPVADLPQEHALSESVFSSLGQAAANFGDDASLKSKSGMTLQFPKLRGKRKADASQLSSPEPSSDAPGSEASSPCADRTQMFSPTSDSSRSSSPTQDKPAGRPVRKRSGDSSPVGGGDAHALLEMMESRSRGTVSLKAYSFSLPPPPSYRPQNQKRAISPFDQAATTDGVATVGFSSGEDEHLPKPGRQEDENLPKPGRQEDEAQPPLTRLRFDSLSEATRMRFLRQSVLKRADEKKRQQELGTSQHESRSESSSGDLSPEAHRAHRKLSDAEETGSSAGTSRSSSSPSSKNPSLDSLLFSEGHKSTQSSPGGNFPWAAGEGTNIARPPSPRQPVARPPSPQQPVTRPEEQHETCVVIPLRKEPRPRLSGPDFQARRRGASFGSESTDSSSEDEGQCVLSMSKTFDEKLKILLDPDYKFRSEGWRRGSGKHLDDDVSSVSSEPQRAPEQTSETPPKRRASDLTLSYHAKGDADGTEAALSGDRTPISFTTNDKSAVVGGVVSSRASLPCYGVPPGRMNSVEIKLNTSGGEPSVEAKPAGGVPSTHEATRTQGRRQASASRRSLPLTAEGRDLQERNRQRNAANTRRSIGSVRTATPVALKEFNITVKKNAGALRRATSEDHSANTKPNAKPPLRGTASVPVGTRRPLNVNLSVSEQHSSSVPRDASRPVPVLTKSRAAAGSRDGGARARLLSQKASARELLPSKGRATERAPTEKLEQNAQHIAELLEEMHSERHLKMSRQRSDISGDAQRAAAQRATWRRRRRSLGDDKVPMATRPGVTAQATASRAPPQRNAEARGSDWYRGKVQQRVAGYQRSPRK